MICTILLNGVLGFAIVLAFCFCVGDLETALTSPTGYDFIEVFYNATKSSAATSVMTSVLITLVICASFGFLASSSRQTWAFARDRGLPFSDYLAHVRIQLSETPSFESIRSDKLCTGQQARSNSSTLYCILRCCYRSHRSHQRRFDRRLQRYCVAHDRWAVHVIHDPDNTPDHQEVQGWLCPLGPMAAWPRWTVHQHHICLLLDHIDHLFVFPSGSSRHPCHHELVSCGVSSGCYLRPYILCITGPEDLPRSGCRAAHHCDR